MTKWNKNRVITPLRKIWHWKNNIKCVIEYGFLEHKANFHQVSSPVIVSDVLFFIPGLGSALKHCCGCTFVSALLWKVITFVRNQDGYDPLGKKRASGNCPIHHNYTYWAAVRKTGEVSPFPDLVRIRRMGRLKLSWNPFGGNGGIRLGMFEEVPVKARTGFYNGFGIFLNFVYYLSP